MKDVNIIFIGENFEYTKAVAEDLSARLDMYFLNSIELIKFDISPANMDEYFKGRPKGYFEESIFKSLKYMSTFENTAIVLPFGMALVPNGMQVLDERGLVVHIKQKQQKAVADTKTEKGLLVPGLLSRGKAAKAVKEYADIVIDANNMGEIKCASEILKQILAYYNV